MPKRLCTLDEYFVTKRGQLKEENTGENEVDLFSNDYGTNKSNGLFSNKVTIGDSTNGSLGNEIATGGSVIEQQLYSKCTVNDKVSYTNNF